MKKGQMKLSFGMIFSIFLIIVFIAFAFYAITKFLSIQTSAEVGRFTNDLQDDIDRMWRSSQGSQEHEYFVPSKVDNVCFIDFSVPANIDSEIYGEVRQNYYETENLFFYPVGSTEGQDAKTIKNIDLSKTTETENPLCFTNINGKIQLTLKKEFGEALVTVSK